MSLLRARIVVTGLVQGVGYRAFAYDAARRHGIKGGVSNRPDGSVELDVEGPRSAIDGLLRDLRTGPRRGRVDGMTVDWADGIHGYADFQIWY
jgi:acylphosphatase